MMSINEIKNHSFKLQRGGSYKASEVDAFMQEVRATIDALATTYENAKKDNEELYRKMNVLADKIEEYRKSEDSIRSTLLTAQRFADTVISEANEKAEKLVSEAQAKADEAIASVKGETDDYVITKKNDADIYAANLTAQADSYYAQKKAESDELFAKAKSEYDEKSAQAEAKAAAILEKAEAEALKVINDCEEKKSEIIAKANTQADEIVANTQARIEFSQKKLDDLKAMTAEFKLSVADVLKREIELLDEITVNDNDYSAEYFPTEYSIDADAIYRPELTIDEENTVEEVEGDEVFEEEDVTITEDGLEIPQEEEEEEITEPVQQEDEQPKLTQDAEVEDVEIPDEDESNESAEEATEAREKDYFAQLMESLANGKPAPDSEIEDVEIEDISDEEDEPEVETKEAPAEVKENKNVFTKIDFFEGTEDDEDDDIDISSGRVELSTLGDDELRFGTDYDIFGEDEDTQPSFFGKFKKK